MRRETETERARECKSESAHWIHSVAWYHEYLTVPNTSYFEYFPLPAALFKYSIAKQFSSGLTKTFQMSPGERRRRRRLFILKYHSIFSELLCKKFIFGQIWKTKAKSYIPWTMRDILFGALDTQILIMGQARQHCGTCSNTDPKHTGGYFYHL